MSPALILADRAGPQATPAFKAAILIHPMGPADHAVVAEVDVVGLAGRVDDVVAEAAMGPMALTQAACIM